MTTQVIRTGSSIRVVVQGRGIASTTINGAGHLIVTYDDGMTDDAGYVGGGGTPSPTLVTLTLSGSLQIGVAASGTIGGATTGSAIVGNIPGITVNSGARTYAGTPTGPAATISNGIVETLAGAINSPKSSAVSVAAAGTLSPLNLSQASFTIGTPASGTITGPTMGSTITASGLPTGLTINGAARTFAYDGTGTSGTTVISLTETLAGYSNSPNANSVSVALAASVGGVTPTLSAPRMTAQVSPTAYPPAPAYTFYGDHQVGDVYRIQAASDYAFAYLLVNDATVTLTGVNATDKAAINAKLSGIASGITYLRGRIERSAGTVISDWANTVQHGTAALPTITSGLTATVNSTFMLSNSIVLSGPVASIAEGGDDQYQLEIVNANQSASTYLERWAGNGTRAYSPSNPADADFNLDHIYSRTLTLTGLNGVIGSPQAGGITVAEYDTTPDAFTFADVTGATQSTNYESNTITVAGMAAGYTGTDGAIAGGAYSKNGGAYVSTTPFSYTVGDTFKVRLMSSASYATAVNATLSLGSVSDTYTVTTQADPSSINPTFRNATTDQHGNAGTPSVHSVVLKTGLNIIAVVLSNGSPASAAISSGATMSSTPVANNGGDKSILMYEATASADGTYTFTITPPGGAGFADVHVYAVHLASAAAGPTEVDANATGFRPMPSDIGNGTTCPPGGIILVMARGATIVPTFSPGTLVKSATTPGLVTSFGYLTASATATYTTDAYSGDAAIAVAWSKV